MKKIFIVTGEPSGDKLASRVISNLKKKTSEIEYLCLGGPHLKSLGIKSIFDLSHSPFISVPTELAIFIWSSINEFNPLKSEARFLFSAVVCFG